MKTKKIITLFILIVIVVCFSILIFMENSSIKTLFKKNLNSFKQVDKTIPYNKNDNTKPLFYLINKLEKTILKISNNQYISEEEFEVFCKDIDGLVTILSFNGNYYLNELEDVKIKLFLFRNKGTIYLKDNKNFKENLFLLKKIIFNISKNNKPTNVAS